MRLLLIGISSCSSFGLEKVEVGNSIHILFINSKQHEMHGLKNIIVVSLIIAIDALLKDISLLI